MSRLAQPPRAPNVNVPSWTDINVPSWTRIDLDALIASVTPNTTTTLPASVEQAEFNRHAAAERAAWAGPQPTLPTTPTTSNPSNNNPQQSSNKSTPATTTQTSSSRTVTPYFPPRHEAVDILQRAASAVVAKMTPSAPLSRREVRLLESLLRILEALRTVDDELRITTATLSTTPSLSAQPQNPPTSSTTPNKTTPPLLNVSNPSSTDTLFEVVALLAKRMSVDVSSLCTTLKQHTTPVQNTPLPQPLSTLIATLSSSQDAPIPSNSFQLLHDHLATILSKHRPRPHRKRNRHSGRRSTTTPATAFTLSSSDEEDNDGDDGDFEGDNASSARDVFESNLAEQFAAACREAVDSERYPKFPGSIFSLQDYDISGCGAPMSTVLQHIASHGAEVFSTDAQERIRKGEGLGEEGTHLVQTGNGDDDKGTAHGSQGVKKERKPLSSSPSLLPQADANDCIDVDAIDFDAAPPRPFKKKKSVGRVSRLSRRRPSPHASAPGPSFSTRNAQQQHDLSRHERSPSPTPRASQLLDAVLSRSRAGERADGATSSLRDDGARDVGGRPSASGLRFRQGAPPTSRSSSPLHHRHSTSPKGLRPSSPSRSRGTDANPKSVPYDRRRGDVERSYGRGGGGLRGPTPSSPRPRTPPSPRVPRLSRSSPPPSPWRGVAGLGRGYAGLRGKRSVRDSPVRGGPFRFGRYDGANSLSDARRQAERYGAEGDNGRHSRNSLSPAPGRYPRRGAVDRDRWENGRPSVPLRPEPHTHPAPSRLEGLRGSGSMRDDGVPPHLSRPRTAPPNSAWAKAEYRGRGIHRYNRNRTMPSSGGLRQQPDTQEVHVIGSSSSPSSSHLHSSHLQGSSNAANRISEQPSRTGPGSNSRQQRTSPTPVVEITD